MKRSWKVFLLVFVLLVPMASAFAENKMPGILSLLLGDKEGAVFSAGQIWMDRNLGASQVATGLDDEAAYGDLYQWGRVSDGHEKRTSGTTPFLSSSNIPGHGDFITTAASPRDWRSTRNDNLWQGGTDINNPCPSGFRLPTETEWDIERASWIPGNSTGAYNSTLKLVPAGYRGSRDGILGLADSYGLYWSGTVDGGDSLALFFRSDINDITNFSRAGGQSVRCIED